VVSTDGLIDREAKTLMKKLSAMLAEKWEKLYAEVCGCVNAQMSIAIIQVTHTYAYADPEFLPAK
jgi:hypothetical protein